MSANRAAYLLFGLIVSISGLAMLAPMFVADFLSRSGIA
jgi:hypothetical protein